MLPERTRELPVRSGISLVHDPGVHQGKTGGMDKGLFLRAGGRLCAGESGGFGLPVLMTRARTIFPACTRVECPDALTMQKTFSMEKALQWHLGEAMAPALFARALERAVDRFMRFPALQQGLLTLRNTLFRLLRVKSSMTAADPAGCCVVTYRASPRGLLVQVDSSPLEGKGAVILLNEVEGSVFTRLRRGSLVLEGKGIPAWQKATFAHCLESPAVGLSVSLAPGPGHEPTLFKLFCGRELGWMLDWAGIALSCTRPVFSYQVLFARKKRAFHVSDIETD
jgi:hypothetical protein